LAERERLVSFFELAKTGLPDGAVLKDAIQSRLYVCSSEAECQGFCQLELERKLRTSGKLLIKVLEIISFLVWLSPSQKG
jgi:hypothetical protein